MREEKEASSGVKRKDEVRQERRDPLQRSLEVLFLRTTCNGN